MSLAQAALATRERCGTSWFQMFPEGENAWLASTDLDEKMVVAMKRGATAVLTVSRRREPVTPDTFSLSRVTAAPAVARDLCE